MAGVRVGVRELGRAGELGRAEGLDRVGTSMRCRDSKLLPHRCDGEGEMKRLFFGSGRDKDTDGYGWRKGVVDDYIIRRSERRWMGQGFCTGDDCHLRNVESTLTREQCLWSACSAMR